MRTTRARTIVAALCAAALLLALALPLSGGLAAAVLPAPPELALLERGEPVPAQPAQTPHRSPARPLGARGPPSAR